MSLRSALDFIQKAEKVESLRDKIGSLGPDGSLQEVVMIAAEAGFDFTADELETAFKKDWSMRWAFYQCPSRDRE